MARADLTITINRPVEDVFTVLTTPGDTPKWSPNAVAEEMTTAGPVGVGSRRRAVVKTFGGRATTNETVVTEFERNRKVAMRAISAPIPFRASWSFTPVSGGTRVDWTWVFEPAGVLRPLGPLVAVIFKRGFSKDLNRLKQMMETGKL